MKLEFENFSRSDSQRFPWVGACSVRSICRPPASPHPVRCWINVWLWETCRWQMFTFIMHDFHVAVNFLEPAKSRKWFCTLCLFNEIVTLMEVRLNKMEMTVSVCHFYNFFPPLILFTSSHPLGIYGPMQRSLIPEVHISGHCGFSMLSFI